MTPEQKIKHAIINRSAEWADEKPPVVNIDNVEDIYEDLVEKDEHWDALYEMREGQIETDIPSESSRHYESKSVAMQAPDGAWIGWTYWYGGGKHAEPDAIDWMDVAYELDCKEEEKVVVVREFTKLDKTA